MGRCSNRRKVSRYNAIDAVVIGCSAGGLRALRMLLQDLPTGLRAAIIICAHLSPDCPGLLPRLLATQCRLPVSEAIERESIVSGHVYIAPPNYHLLIEPEHRFALSVDKRVCYVRPAIDLLFTTAADAYRERLLGIILTGANNDGTQGLQAIKAVGGKTIVQDPITAEADTMPRSAIASGAADLVLPLSGIVNELLAFYPTFYRCSSRQMEMS